VSQVASQRKSFVVVLAAVSRVINRTIAQNETLLTSVLHCNIYLAFKYVENYAFLCEQYHIDKNMSTNCVIVCATRGYINAANLCLPVSCYIHRSTMKYMKLMHLCWNVYFFISYDHLTPMSHKGSKYCLWQLVQCSGRLQCWKLKFSSTTFKTFYRKNDEVYFVEICTVGVKQIVISLVKKV